MTKAKMQFCAISQNEYFIFGENANWISQYFHFLEGRKQKFSVSLGFTHAKRGGQKITFAFFHKIRSLSAYFKIKNTLIFIKLAQGYIITAFPSPSGKPSRHRTYLPRAHNATPCALAHKSASLDSHKTAIPPASRFLQPTVPHHSHIRAPIYPI